MRKAWRRPSWPLVLWCFAWALLGVVALHGCRSAEAQDPPVSSAPVDPQTQLILQALEQSRSDPTVADLLSAVTQSPILAVILGLLGLRVQPQILGALGRSDPEVTHALGRIEAKLITLEQEVGHLRELKHDLPDKLTPITMQLGLIEQRLGAIEERPGASRR